MTMTGQVQSLLEFHSATSFGNRANLLLRQSQARSTYLALTENDRAELAQVSIAQIGKGNNRLEQALCCLACLHPVTLATFHHSLLERGILFPGMIFHGASSEIAEQLAALCEQDNCRNHALTALAWIGDDIVQAAFLK